MIRCLSILCFIILLASCSKEKKSVWENQWEAISIEQGDNVIYPSSKVILSFEDQKNYILKLDINSCGGKVSFGASNKINFERGACTEACCDSEFAQKLASMLSGNHKFEIEGDTLTLKGDNGDIIKFRKI